MKKTTEKKSSKAKLELNKDVLKRLTNTELKNVVGGSSYNESSACGSGGSYSDDCGGTGPGGTGSVGTKSGYAATSIC